jgi:hypothetical protein
MNNNVNIMSLYWQEPEHQLGTHDNLITIITGVAGFQS